MRRLALLSSLAAVAGCADGGGAGTPFASGPGAAEATTAGDASGDTSGNATDEGASNSSDPTLDPTSATDDDPTGELTSTGPGIDCPAGEAACGVLCVDLQTDSTNCGDCGITCVVPNSDSSCVAGSCTVGSCTAGWFDCDGNAANGCEAQMGCSAGESCTTECGSTGITSCNGCDTVCDLPAETCNAIDDDCNGACDEGALAGCREPVHRANGPNGHYYTNVLAETSQEGRSLESENYWWMYTEQHDGLSALYRCDLGSGRYFLTTSNVCEGANQGAGSIDDTLGYLAPGASCGATALYRLRSPAGRHFYTVSSTERDNAINNLSYIDEGTTGYVWTAP
ncbi:MAG: hypothetical protein ACE37F_32075 [Nannocystaceae bacterium]|nr:hypothetical protein [bacterium]